MIRVLIVDDEPIYRLALRELIDWEALGCDVAAEASNGADALKIVGRERIDLVVIDIQMPILDGLAFIERTRAMEEARGLGIVVLSAYSQYEYVRQAFVHGVYDYIVKEDLSAEKTGPVIARAVARLKEEQSSQELQAQESSVKLERLKEETALRLLRKGREEELAPGMAEWLAGIASKRQAWGCLRIDRPPEAREEEEWEPDEQQGRFLRHSLRQVAEACRLEAVVAELSRTEYAVLALLPAERSELRQRESAAELFKQLVQHARTYLNLSITCGVSAPCEAPASWPARYAEARRQAERRFYSGGGRVYAGEPIPPYPAQADAHPDEAVWDEVAIVQELESGSREWRRRLEEGAKRLRKAQLLPVERILRPYKALCWELEALLLAKGAGWDELLGTVAKPFPTLERFESFERLNEWFRRLLENAAELIDPKRIRYEQAPPLIERIKGWVDRHCREPISLASASEANGISESYLSKLFVKETGTTFVEYVTRKRVELAIELMGTGMKIYEIGEQVGYPNQGHFSKTFKKVTGKSPQEYRDELSRLGRI